MDRISQQKILVVSHYSEGHGPVFALRNYFNERRISFYLIIHPISGSSTLQSKYQEYSGGNLLREVVGYGPKRPNILRYIKDVVQTIYFACRVKGSFDLYIGIDNLNAFSGLILKKIGKVKKVIFYTADFSPRRFPNPFLEKIYHFIDNLCVCWADILWNVSQRIRDLRKQKNNREANNFVVPNTIDFDFVPRHPDKTNNTIVFVGDLKRETGLEEFLEVCSSLCRKIPSLKLFIIGCGLGENSLKDLTAQKGLEKNVEFLCYMAYEGAINFIARCSLGFSPYPSHLDNVSHLAYCDPSKVKTYLACGCPVVIRDVPDIAQKIQARKAGMVYHNSSELEEVFLTLLANSKLLQQYSQNAQYLAKEYDNIRVFDRAFIESGYSLNGEE